MEQEQIGVARYNIDPDGERCKFAIVVSDRIRRQGLGTRLMAELMESARNRGLREILAENRNRLKLMRHPGFSVFRDDEDPSLKRATKTLSQALKVPGAAAVPASRFRVSL